MYLKQKPEQSVTVCHPQKTYDGYTLFAPHASTDVWLIDMKGRVVHHWKMPTFLGSDVRLLSNGNQIRVNKTGEEPTSFLGTGGGELVEVDWEGNIVWEYEDLYMHHDFSRLENGNTVLNRYVRIPKEVAAKVKGGIPGTDLEDGTMWGAGFQEITRDGEIIWEWLGYEHMDLEIDVPCPLCPHYIWGYVNGIDVFPNGDIVGSFRCLNTLAIIDKKTGEIKWRWGKKELGHQHHPTVQKNGNVLVFDNGFHRLGPDERDPNHLTSGYSQVLEVNPKTNQIEWQYRAKDHNSFYSAICSSAERLPNGNTLICESTGGRIFEVTPEGEVVWEFVNPFFEYKPSLGWTNYIFRAHRYRADFPGLKGKDLDPDKFEFVLREKGKLTQETDEHEKAIRLRLGHLGY
ncbi:hypothetical protein ES703_90483 [subsurface metagenome]